MGETEEFDRGPDCNNSGPVTSKVGAQASVQLSVAVILASGDVDGADSKNFKNPRVARIASISEILIDPELTKALPEQNGTRLEVHLDDGTVVTASQNNHRPMTEDEIIERFRREAEARVGVDRTSIAKTAFATLASGGDIKVGLRALAKTASDNLPVRGA
jgi:2-methylcitrate dehydratase PrpD